MYKWFNKIKLDQRQWQMKLKKKLKFPGTKWKWYQPHKFRNVLVSYFMYGYFMSFAKNCHALLKIAFVISLTCFNQNINNHSYFSCYHSTIVKQSAHRIYKHLLYRIVLVFLLWFGASPRNSAHECCQPINLKFNKLFDGADWDQWKFHFTFL